MNKLVYLKEGDTMAEYIRALIVTKISIEKEEIERFFFQNEKTREGIEEKLSEFIDLNLYDFKKDKNYYIYTLKKDVLNHHLKSFLIEQMELIHNDDIINQLNYIDQLVDFFEDKYNHIEDISFSNRNYLKHTYLLENHYVYCEGIEYFKEGKVILENYYSFFRYISKLIQLSSTNPLSKTIYIDIY